MIVGENDGVEPALLLYAEKRIDCPNLDSIIESPSYNFNLCIFGVNLKYFPNLSYFLNSPVLSLLVIPVVAVSLYDCKFGALCVEFCFGCIFNDISFMAALELGVSLVGCILL